MSSIKSFIYLDEYKMYSISSQIFEGLTEYVVDYSVEGKEEKEEQRGQVGSGRVLADIIRKETGTEERKFLHDYSYTLFEKKLIEDQKVIVIDRDNIGEKISKIPDYDIIKVSGKMIFNDTKLIVETLKDFNKIGESITYITNHEDIKQHQKNAKESLTEIKDRNKRAIMKKRAENDIDIKKLAEETGLRLDPQFINDLSFMIDYGYKDQFEVQIPIKSENRKEENVIFSSILKRQLLKDKEDILVRKYSRKSEKEFTIFGMITQSEREMSTHNDPQDIAEFSHLKQALMNMTAQFSKLEDTYIGRLANEVIIDPIALYREM